MTASAAKAAEGYSCRVALGLGKPEIPSAGGSGRLSKPVRTRQPLRLAGPIAWSIIIALVIVISLTLGSRAEAGGLLWLVETVDAGEGVGVYTSITLDDQGRPHIVYVDRKTDTVKYAVREAGVWETRVVDAGGGFAGSTNLIVDTQGQPHVSYFSEKRNALLYAVGNGSQWERHRVDAPVIRGFHGLALDSHGRPYLAYAYLNT
ncbi:MAG: hypothetical protein GTO63_06380, partial [Anaerolineae bacterium]|nr:hypothetical protein [Anaerolineae bacterium]NIN94599.1 hypothetical protein [Anaerolineae bacterium]